MKLDPLDRRYAYGQIRWQRHTYTKPTKDRSYIILLRILDLVPFYPSSTLRKQFGARYNLTLGNLEALHFIDHYREGRKTFWRVTEKGHELISKAY